MKDMVMGSQEEAAPDLLCNSLSPLAHPWNDGLLPHSAGGASPLPVTVNKKTNSRLIQLAEEADF